MIDVWISQYLLKDEIIKCLLMLFYKPSTNHASCSLVAVGETTAFAFDVGCGGIVLSWFRCGYLTWLCVLLITNTAHKNNFVFLSCFSFVISFLFLAVFGRFVYFEINCMVHVVITIYRLLFPTKIDVCVGGGDGSCFSPLYLNFFLFPSISLFF